MIIQHIAFCRKCQGVWRVPLEQRADVWFGVLTGGHKECSPKCDAPKEHLQALNGQLSELPSWAREKATELFAGFHWSETSTGYAFWKEAFRVADLPDVEEKELEAGTHTNGQIARKCPDGKHLLARLMQLPKGGSRASARSMLSFAVDML